MVMQCSLPNCRVTIRNSKHQVHKLSFHRLPFGQPERLKAWCSRLEKYGLQVDQNSEGNKRNLYRVCSKHFRPEDYEPSSNTSKLKPYAVPSIFETEDLHARASAEKTPNHRFLHDHGLYAIGTHEDLKQKLENVNFLQEQLKRKTELVVKERRRAKRVTTVLQSIAQQQGLGYGQSSSKIARIVKQNLEQSGQLTSQTGGQDTQNIPEVNQPQNIPEVPVQPENIPDIKTPISDILSRMVDTVRQQSSVNIKEEVVIGTNGEVCDGGVGEEDETETDEDGGIEADDAIQTTASKDVTCLTPDESKRIMSYFMDVLGSKIIFIKMMAINQISSHPVTLKTPIRKIKKHKHRKAVEAPQEVVQRVELEVNGRHHVIKKLLAFKSSNPQLAKLIAEQVYDNARIVAGEMDDNKSMLERLNTIMEATMDKD